MKFLEITTDLNAPIALKIERLGVIIPLTAEEFAAISEEILTLEDEIQQELTIEDTPKPVLTSGEKVVITMSSVA